MAIEYYVMEFVGNLKTDDDKVRFSVEPMDGGGIEFTGETLEDAQAYVDSVDGVLTLVV